MNAWMRFGRMWAWFTVKLQPSAGESRRSK